MTNFWMDVLDLDCVLISTVVALQTSKGGGRSIRGGSLYEYEVKRKKRAKYAVL
jgi:hypothetical protein